MHLMLESILGYVHAFIFCWGFPENTMEYLNLGATISYHNFTVLLVKFDFPNVSKILEERF